VLRQLKKQQTATGVLTDNSLLLSCFICSRFNV
jgi:hypothetical protein